MNPTTFRASLAVLLCALAASSCGRNASSSPSSPLVDSAGAEAEARRSDLQFASARDTAAVAGGTRAGLDLARVTAGSLEADVRAYRETLSVSGSRATDRAGAVDWRETWLQGRVDRPALALALVRSLVDTSARLVEWSLSDSLARRLDLRVVFQRPGAYGGAIDSVHLSVGAAEIRRP